MRIVFWQNCLSPHQLPYIVHLMDDERVDSVVVAAGEALLDVRKDMGWECAEFPGLEKCEVYVNPSSSEIENLLSERKEDSIHLFSGIRGFQFVFQAFEQSMKFDLERGLVTERPNTFAFGRPNGKPLWLHRIRFFLQDRKYVNLVKHVFAMGDEAANYFRSVWKKWEVYPFAYCTQDYLETPYHPQNSGLQFVFIGSLAWRKAVGDILKAYERLSQSSQDGVDVNLIGDGPERAGLEAYQRQHHLGNVHFLGTKKNSEIPQLLATQDVLILPSVYDGWGAVVNEALTAGLYVICSDRCGAKELLADARCGMVFRAGDVQGLSACMNYCTANFSEIRRNRTFRATWAKERIGGKAVSKYMLDCLSGEAPQRPWLI